MKAFPLKPLQIFCKTLMWTKWPSKLTSGAAVPTSKKSGAGYKTQATGRRDGDNAMNAQRQKIRSGLQVFCS
jgi:hypothetical protein